MKLHAPQLRPARLMRSRTSNLRSLFPRHPDRTKYAYDPVGRLASDVVSTLPAGVDGSVRRIDYAYQDDGKLSTITTYSATSVGNIVNQVKYTYDGWGSIKTEQSHAGGVTTGTPAITYTYEDGADENGNALYIRLKKVTYPSGREVHYIYEAPPTSRLLSISENSGGTQNSGDLHVFGHEHHRCRIASAGLRRVESVAISPTGTYAGLGPLWPDRAAALEERCRHDGGWVHIYL